MANQNQLALVPPSSNTDSTQNNGGNNSPSGQPSGPETNKNKKYQKKKKRYQNSKKNKNKKKVSSFKGTITEMNGHVFQCQSERPTGNQFLRSVSELKSYVSIKMTKYPHDIIYILKHMEECVIVKPAPPGANADRTDTRIWEK